MAAHRFGCRPSEMVVMRDRVLALDFDLAATARLLGAERKITTEDFADLNETNSAPASAQELYW